MNPERTNLAPPPLRLTPHASRRDSRIVVVGCRGMLATDLAPRLAQAGFSVGGCDLPEVDITDFGATRAALQGAQPGLAINCAAYTAVDRAESEPNAAFAVNRDGARNLAHVCGELGIPMVHISTDYIFDGVASRPYREDDPANPLGVYGLSKWEGEEAIRFELTEHLIIRTAWLFGAHGQNFVKTMLRLAREREELRVVADQWGSPTWTGHLADCLVSVATRILQERDLTPWGTYHFCGAGETTWHAFATAIVEKGGEKEPLRVRKIVPISAEEYPTPARRPKWSVLDCAKISRTFHVEARHWMEGLEEMLGELYGETLGERV